MSEEQHRQEFATITLEEAARLMHIAIRVLSLNEYGMYEKYPKGIRLKLTKEDRKILCELGNKPGDSYVPQSSSWY